MNKNKFEQVKMYLEVIGINLDSKQALYAVAVLSRTDLN